MPVSEKKQLFSVRAHYPAAVDAADAVLTRMRADLRLAAPAVRVSAPPGVLELRGNVHAGNAAAAGEIAIRRFVIALRRARATDSPAPIELAVEPFTRSGNRSEIVSGAEVARRLGLSRERVRQLAESPGRFPVAVGNIRGSRAWRWGDVADWLSAGGRRPPGRPRARRKPEGN